jgi:hypothetical protein
MWHDDEDDLDDDQDDETIPCPHCREPVYEDAEQCPSCGKYLSREDIPWRRPAWLIVGVVITLAIVIYGFLP